MIKLNKNKSGFVLIAASFMVVVSIVIVFIFTSLNESEANAAAESLKFKVEEEEFSFYLDIVGSSEVNRERNEELIDKTKEYTRQMYARWILAHQSSIIEPFSFDQLKLQHIEENNKRKKMKEEGQVFYGPEQLELRDYYEYKIDEAANGTIKKIADEANRELVEESKRYYNEIKEIYTDETIEFDRVQVFEDGKLGEIERVLINNDNKRIMENSDPEMIRFLENLKEGEEASYERYDNHYLITMRSKESHQRSFEDNKYNAIKNYVEDIYYEERLSEIFNKLEIEFVLNGKSISYLQKEAY
ncbi:MAG: hypothetical protein ACE3L7_05400 [Candidatus Pristimantibacillus sp.]